MKQTIETIKRLSFEAWLSIALFIVLPVIVFPLVASLAARRRRAWPWILLWLLLTGFRWSFQPSFTRTNNYPILDMATGRLSLDADIRGRLVPR